MSEKEDTQVEHIQPCVVMFNGPEGLVCMVNNNEFETPAIWGIVIADLVKHIVNAYAKDGMAGPHVHQEIVHYLLSELESPTAKAQRVDATWHDEGFTIGDEE